VCEQEAKQGLLGLVGRGFKTVIRPEFKESAAAAVCKDCGLCAKNCPTGALRIL
jgi:formate dehydrogenase major subunit